VIFSFCVLLVNAAAVAPPVGVVADGEPTFLPSRLAKCDSKASSKLLGALLSSGTSVLSTPTF